MVQANAGGARAAETIEGVLSAHEFVSLGSVVGNGYAAGAVLGDEAALTAARETGRRIVTHLGRR